SIFSDSNWFGPIKDSAEQMNLAYARAFDIFMLRMRYESSQFHELFQQAYELKPLTNETLENQYRSKISNGFLLRLNNYFQLAFLNPYLYRDFLEKQLKSLQRSTPQQQPSSNAKNEDTVDFIPDDRNNGSSPAQDTLTLPIIYRFVSKSWSSYRHYVVAWNGAALHEAVFVIAPL